MQFNLLKLLILTPLFASMNLEHSYGAGWKVEESGKEIEGVKLASSLMGSIEDSVLSLKSVGSALRVKKVLFVKAKVYVGELFFSQPEKFSRNKDDALKSLLNSDSVALKITFLRDVDKKTFREALLAGWKENGVSAKDPWAENLLEKVWIFGDWKKGDSLIFSAVKTRSGDLIIIDNFRGMNVLLPSKTGSRTNLFSLWLGKPADSGIEDFRDQLLK